MESLYILIPVAIVFVAIAIVIFIWAVKSEQFEDLERQGHNILFEEDEPIKKESSDLLNTEKESQHSPSKIDN
ncbi:cbb3-type cytochrome oxidase assembly protein CcoS [Vibrio sp. SS-MA-C1-2]|uniref:cbb3-type cytochrome oxidase assembly protein CcoS n=1 Tax=Vibrio sp. SS-MA-C1-2 TaxID=2908646 RepID=UPI00288318D1|nr:cbb3-type cytochrome oxidase assembly protein CcoS [Vibrio sp. SS-MA-C1-2]